MLSKDFSSHLSLKPKMLSRLMFYKSGILFAGKYLFFCIFPFKLLSHCLFSFSCTISKFQYIFFFLFEMLFSLAQNHSVFYFIWEIFLKICSSFFLFFLTLSNWISSLFSPGESFSFWSRGIFLFLFLVLIFSRPYAFSRCCFLFLAFLFFSDLI